MNINYKTKLLQCLMLLLFMSSHWLASAQNQPLDFFQVEQVHNSNIVQNAYMLSIDEVEYDAFMKNKPYSFELVVPIDHNTSFTLDLEENDIFSDNFVVTENDGQKQKPVTYNKGLYYKGSVQGMMNTIAAISFFEGEIIGIISTSAGDYVIGAYDPNDPTTKNATAINNGFPSHIIYNDKNLLINHNFECATDDVAHNLSSSLPAAPPPPPGGGSSAQAPVDVFFDADYDLYLDKNSSTTDVTNYVTGFFNSVASLYSAFTVPATVQISQVNVWTSTDPYPNSSSGAALDAFAQQQQNSFNGDLAHLVSTASGNNGGLAWVGVLCATYNPNSFSGPYAYSNISTSYNNFPTYSWTVEVVAHEMGHNLDAPHTHSCAWNGNNTQIDDCGNQYSPSSAGSCYNSASPILPTSGTVMSYCHLVSGIGIDFNNGFHSQVQTRINAHITNASCVNTSLPITCNTSITSFPSTEDFNSGTLCNAGGGCIADQNCSTALPIGWLNDSGDATDWSVASGSTASSGTGPSSGYGGSGQYLYVEASSGCDAKQADLVSPCYDLTNISSTAAPKVSFAYHMYGSDMGSLAVYVSNDDGSTWNLEETISGNRGNQWHTKTICLAAYSGQTIHIRFRAITGGAYKSDIAIDEVVVDDFNANASLTPSTLTTPSDAATAVAFSSPITFNWTHNQGVNVDSMRIQISKVSSTGVSFFTEDAWLCGDQNEASGDLVVNTNMVTVSNGQGSFTWPTTADPSNGIGQAPQSGTTYYWTVRYNVPGTGHSYYTGTFSFTTDGPQGCTSTTQYPNTTFTPSTSWETANTCIYAGEYSLYNVTSGETYYWSLCSADGGVASYDSELTLRDNSNDAFITYANDSCGGDDARIVWTATFTGQVKAVVTEYSCQSNTTCSTLRYKKDGITITPSFCTPPNTPATLPWTENFESTNGTYNEGSIVCAPTYAWDLETSAGECRAQVGTDSYAQSTGNGAITLDRTPNGTVETNDLILTLNLSNYTTNTGLELAFDFTHHSEESHTNDRVWIRGSSSDTWLEIYDWDANKGTSGTWINVSGLDIDALLSNNAQAPSATFQVRFGQEDNYPVGTDGMSIDNVVVSTMVVPGLDCSSPVALTCGQTYSGTTVGSGSNVSSYNCIGWSETGPEVVHTITTTMMGDLTASISNLGADLDIFILSSCSATSCDAYGDNSATYTNAPAGTYYIVVDGYQGASSSYDLTVVCPVAPPAVAQQSINVDCNGASTGSISLSITGGQAPFTYAWSNGATTQNLTGIAAGSYNCTITDVNNQTVQTGAITITEPPAVTGSATVTNVDCNGASTGAIDLTASGGTGAFTYAWNTTAQTEDLTNLGAGIYAVTITDANACTGTVTNITVTEPAVITTSTSVVNTNCNGSSTGSIDLSVSGGTSGYTYAWSNGASTQDLSNVAAGTYSVTVTDANNCVKTVTGLTVTEPTAITGTTSVINTTCATSSDGSVDLSVSGGMSGYTYAWSNGANTEDLSNVAAGTYTVTITDANNCSQTVSGITVSSPTAISGTTMVTNVDCNGSSTGAVDLSVSGGTSGYTYSWSNGAVTEDLSNIAANTYTVTITDANNCSQTVSNIQVTEPAAIALSNTTTNVSCNGACDGSIAINATGGAGGFSYVWCNSQTTATATNLCPGACAVTVTDANGCTSTLSNLTITEPTAITETTVVTNVLCNGASTGAVDLSVSGGAGNYTYAWSNGTMTEDLSNIPAGSYAVTITDASGCIKTVSNIQVTEPTALTPNATVTQHACNGNDGAISVSPTGGTAPYVISPSNPSNLSPGSYTFTITDANNCTVQTSSIDVVGVAVAAFDTSTVDLEVSFTNQSTSGDTYSWDFGDGNTSTDENPIHTYAASGVYTVILTVTNACGSVTSTMNIELIATNALEVLNENLLKIFPNPAKSYLQIQHQLTGDWSLELINVLGQTIISKTNITQDELLDVSELTTGTYFVRLYNEVENKTIRKKVQIMK